MMSQELDRLPGCSIVDCDHGTGEPHTVEIPDRFGGIIDRVMDRDTAYFERQPERRRYTRPYVPGEAWPMFGSADLLVTVYRLCPGFRLRYFHESSERPPRRFPLETIRGIELAEMGPEAAERVQQNPAQRE